jgi:glycosyltransferase involved in cell wall biosynthesis
MGAAAVSDGGRLWFDVSYTLTQTGNVGITRTVRRLLDELRELQAESGSACEPVAFHSSGFRHASRFVAVGHVPKRSPHRGGQRLFRLLSGSMARRMIGLAQRVLPWPLLQWVWRKSSVATFNALSREAGEVHFEPGDILFVADASWKYPAWLAARSARRQGARVVVLVYDLMPIRNPEFCFGLVPPLFRNWLHHMLNCSDAVICISKATENDLRTWVRELGAAGPCLPPTGNFRLGSDISVAHAGVPRAQLSSFVASSSVCFGAVGSFEPKKNYAFLIDVFDQLWAGGADWRLVIAGRPTPECAPLLSRVRNHPEQGRRLLTILDATDEEIGQIYGRCRALVFPSLMEGFGLPLVEARTRGCPVIASDLPVFMEVADQGISFFERSSASALKAVLARHAAIDQRQTVGSMPPFLWRDSARQCRAQMTLLLAPASA